MTSSLVGSEMCIRDRGRGERREAGEGKGAGWVGRLVGQLVGRLVRQWAVSYTHLTLPTICSV
eukprot:8938738-Prorocentrum_lima.AAC.1